MFNLELFKTFEYWRKQSNWEKECYQTPGFDQNIVKESKNSINLDDFNSVISRFNRSLLTVVKICLKRDYMSARNAIIMLQKLSHVYPTNKDIILELEDRFKLMIEQCEQDDLKTLANAYVGVLQRKLRNEKMNSSRNRHKSNEREQGEKTRKRDDKYDAKEKEKSKHTSRNSRSPAKKDRSEPDSRKDRDRHSKSPQNKSNKSRSKSKDSKNKRKRAKHHDN